MTIQTWSYPQCSEQWRLSTGSSLRASELPWSFAWGPLWRKKQKKKPRRNIRRSKLNEINRNTSVSKQKPGVALWSWEGEEVLYRFLKLAFLYSSLLKNVLARWLGCWSCVGCTQRKTQSRLRWYFVITPCWRRSLCLEEANFARLRLPFPDSPLTGGWCRKVWHVLLMSTLTATEQLHLVLYIHWEGVTICSFLKWKSS